MLDARSGRVGDMEAFLHVAEAGTFAAAGRRLGLTPSAVSKLIARLESRLRVSLFTRSRRGLSLSQEGLLYRHHCERLVSEIDDVERSLLARGGRPHGQLRIAAPRGFSTHQLVPLLPEFLALHPGIEVELAATESASELLEGSTEAAIHVGRIHDESLHARKIAVTESRVVASPSYVDARGTPEAPDDLASHNCLRRRFGRAADEWSFLVGGHVCLCPVSGNLRADTAETLRRLALAGLGVAWLPDFMVARDVREGRLVRLLDAFRSGHVEPVNALYAGDRHVPSRVRAFVDFLADRFGRVTPW